MTRLVDIIKPRKRKIKKAVKYHPPLSERQVIKAIRDSFGNVSVIAHKLDRPYSTVSNYIRKAGDDIQEAMRVEKERMVDIAEQTNVEMMMQRIHFPTAIRASHFILTKHPDAEKRGYKDKSQLSIQGGKPIRVEHKHIMSIDKLKTIDIDTRRKMLSDFPEEKDDK